MKLRPLLVAATLAAGATYTSSALACSIPADRPSDRSIIDDDTPECFDIFAEDVVLSVTNSCAFAVTIEPLDCQGCQTETTFEPDSTDSYVVPHTQGQDGPNTIGWSSEQGTGTISYVGSPSEQAPEVDCDDSACSSTGSHPGESPLVAVVLAGLMMGLRRHVRPGL